MAFVHGTALELTLGISRLLQHRPAEKIADRGHAREAIVGRDAACLYTFLQERLAKGRGALACMPYRVSCGMASRGLSRGTQARPATSRVSARRQGQSPATRTSVQAACVQAACVHARQAKRPGSRRPTHLGGSVDVLRGHVRAAGLRSQFRSLLREPAHENEVVRVDLETKAGRARSSPRVSASLVLPPPACLPQLLRTSRSVLLPRSRSLSRASTLDSARRGGLLLILRR
jgi:hypothetical protein